MFVVMGDQGARVYGSQIFPVRSCRVALLTIDSTQKRPSTCSTLASAIDIAPTFMGPPGGDYRSVFFGQDVQSLDASEGYAVMQHNHKLGFLNT